uniref:Ovule protein n=1 Tax=Strongyloides venezuelensis TaxID=75913 RepID=A0A0K0G4R0_STRVS
MFKKWKSVEGRLGEYTGCDFGKCFRVSSLSNHCPVLLQLSYRIHFSSQVIRRLNNGSFLFLRIREDQIT